jgi:predicted peptidase
MKILATILVLIFMLPLFAGALSIPKDLDHAAAVERIENAKLYFLQTGEGSDEDAPVARVFIDYRDLFNTGSLNIYQRLVIINQ